MAKVKLVRIPLTKKGGWVFQDIVSDGRTVKARYVKIPRKHRRRRG